MPRRTKRRQPDNGGSRCGLCGTERAFGEWPMVARIVDGNHVPICEPCRQDLARQARAAAGAKLIAKGTVRTEEHDGHLMTVTVLPEKRRRR